MPADCALTYSLLRSKDVAQNSAERGAIITLEFAELLDNKAALDGRDERLEDGRPDQASLLPVL